jgi:putative transposase
MIDYDHAQLSLRRQCTLLGLNRASLYYRRAGETALNLQLMRLIDEQYLKTPFYGWPRMLAQSAGLCVSTCARTGAARLLLFL